MVQIILLQFYLSFFLVDRKTKLMLFFVYTICLQGVKSPYLPFNNVYYAFLLSELPYLGKHIKSTKKTILPFLMALILGGTFVLFLNSPHYEGFTGFAYLFTYNMLLRYMILCYVFMCFRSMEDLTIIYKGFFFSILILTFFGLTCFIFKEDFFMRIVNPDNVGFYESHGEDMSITRYGSVGMQGHPSMYGIICVFASLFTQYGRDSGWLDRHRFLILMACCIFGILVCGSRSVLFSFLFGYLSYFAITKDTIIKIRYTVLATICLVVACAFIPYFRNILEMVTSLFDSKTELGGSSIDMRLEQFASVWYYIKDDIMFGRGMDFFMLDMGWGENGVSTLLDKSLWGLEGVYLVMILERGLFGFVVYLLFWGCLLFFFYRRRSEMPEMSGLGVSVILSYLCFSFMTGELVSYFLTFLIVGLCVSIAYQQVDHRFSQIG